MIKKLAVLIAAVFLFSNASVACPTGLRAFDKKLNGKDTCVLEGTYVGSLELTSSYNYMMLGAVYIGSEKRDSNLNLSEPLQPGRLIINPGVEIYALNPAKDTTGVWTGSVTAKGTPVQGDIKTFLSVTRDSKIEVKGDEVAPVLMSSAQGMHNGLTNVKRPGDWGGLVVSGKAKSNKCTDFVDCTLPGEANTGYYAGDDDFHSSGVIQYLQVEYGGDRIDDKKELNGITFNAVGLGTLIENVAVLYNSDDCVEFFGGAVTAQNIFCYKGEDDGIDTTDGARVFLQNGIVVAADYPEAGEDNDRHMVEADSSKNDDGNQRLRSHPVLVNFSFVGGVNSQGLKLRRGTNYTLINSVMIGVDRWCMDPSGSEELIFNSNMFAGCSAQDPVTNLMNNEFVKAMDMQINGWVPEVNSPVLSGAEYVEIFFDADEDLDEAFADAYIETEYRGAVGVSDWTAWIQIRD